MRRSDPSWRPSAARLRHPVLAMPAALGALAAALGPVLVAGQSADEHAVGPAPSVRAGRDLLRSEDLVWAGAFAASLALVLPAEALEEEIAESGDRDGKGFDDAFADVGDVAGEGLVDYGLAVGTYVAGKLAGSDASARVGRRTFESLVLANVVVSALKVGFGRSRPRVSEESDRFDFFELDDERRSFPSGHAAQLFAMAGAVSRELGGRAPWVPWVAYPFATYVAASRVVGREHWVTDVVAGAAIGTLASRVVGRFHEGPPGAAPPIRPELQPGPDGTLRLGLAVAVR